RARNVYEMYSNEATYSFTISPPWYRTTFAYIGYLIFFISIIYGAIRYNVRRLEQANKRLQVMIDEATVEIRDQKEDLEEKSKDILASIRYAKKIQDTILPMSELIEESLPDSFVLFKPKDIVSGDFYWFSNQRKNKILISVVDCTGHGVPGAFMSVIGNTLLNEIVNGKGIDQPAEILNNLHVGVRTSLKQDEYQEAGSTRDGMDLAICSIEVGEKPVIEYAGAYRPLIHIRGEVLTDIKPDKMPIGGEQLEAKRIFTNNVVDIEKGDSIYMFSDGYVDQFGGVKGKKFMTARFKKFLIEIRDKTMREQKEILTDEIEKWMGDVHEQIDDICLIGIRF
ncbi:MAG: SpoIIE family protein phosphatase, partial [Bacteroidia bacterium]|nr:SpoIIE family protein phosphatase [Bacteroidia bacterium]